MSDPRLPSQVPIEVVAVAVQRVIRLLVDSGISYAQIAQDFRRHFPNVEMPAENIRKFVQRARDRFVISDTLVHLYLFIQAAKSDFPPFVRENVILHMDVFFSKAADPDLLTSNADASYGFFVANAYRLLARMLHVDYDHARRTAVEIEGAYACFRPSTKYSKTDRLVVSFMTIGAKRGFPDVIEFNHHVANNLREERTSDGFVIGLGGNIYLIGDIEFGRGLEMIVLQRPATRQFTTIVGLSVTLDTNGAPTCSRLILCKQEVEIEDYSKVRPILGPRRTDEIRDDFGDALTNRVLSLLADQAESISSI